VDLSGSFITNLCDGEGNIIGVRKEGNSLFKYNFDLKVFEEYYNVVIINNGSVGLKWAI